jgi:hypothetical protein
MKMNEEGHRYRNRVVEMVELLASRSEQLEYERSVPIADVPSELVCGFVNDLYHPKFKPFIEAFTEDELKSLAELYGRIRIASAAFTEHNCHSVPDIQKLPEWCAVMAFAKDLASELRRNG